MEGIAIVIRTYNIVINDPAEVLWIDGFNDELLYR